MEVLIKKENDNKASIAAAAVSNRKASVSTAKRDN